MSARRVLIAAACLAATSNAAARRVDPPPEEIEGVEVGEQVRRDLGRLFQPSGSIDTHASGEGRANGHLRTRPYATAIPGLCRRDEVIVSYAGPGAYTPGASANAILPFGVAAQAWFRVIHDYDPSAPDNGGRSLAGECAALSATETRGWFAASQDYEAREGYRLFLAAARQVLGPVHRIAGCRENLDSRRTCQRVVQGPERIARVARCFAPQRRTCFEFMLDPETEDVRVTIRFRQNNRGEMRVDAVEIEWPPIMV
jgi:hypothetical protein